MLETEEIISLLWLIVMHYNTLTNEFEMNFENIMLLDVSSGISDQTYARRSDWYFAHRNQTFFFRKEFNQVSSALQSADIPIFQLNMHSVELLGEFDSYIKEDENEQD